MKIAWSGSIGAAAPAAPGRCGRAVIRAAQVIPDPATSAPEDPNSGPGQPPQTPPTR